MENNTIILDTVPHRRKWYSFEECLSVEESSFFYLTTRLLHRYLIFHAHWSVKIGYYAVFLTVLMPISITVDILLIISAFVPRIVLFVTTNLLLGLKFIFTRIWEWFGEVILAFLKKFLSVIGIFCALYAIYVFFKAGAYETVYDFIINALTQLKK